MMERSEGTDMERTGKVRAEAEELCFNEAF